MNTLHRLKDRYGNLKKMGLMTNINLREQSVKKKEAKRESMKKSKHLYVMKSYISDDKLP